MTYEEIIRQKIGEFITIAMKEREIGLNKLQELSGVNRTIIYKIKRGENYEINSLIKIMRILNIHLEFQLLDADNNIFGNQNPN
jgi:DNA-binding phage protein